MPFKDNPAATCASIVNIFVALEAKTQKSVCNGCDRWKVCG